MFVHRRPIRAPASYYTFVGNMVSVLGTERDWLIKCRFPDPKGPPRGRTRSACPCSGKARHRQTWGVVPADGGLISRPAWPSAEPGLLSAAQLPVDETRRARELRRPGDELVLYGVRSAPCCCCALLRQRALPSPPEVVPRGTYVHVHVLRTLGVPLAPRSTEQYVPILCN